MSLHWILLVMVSTVHTQQAYRNSRCQTLNTSARSLQELIDAKCEIEDSDIWKRLCREATTLADLRDNYCILDQSPIWRTLCERATCMKELRGYECTTNSPLFKKLCGSSNTRLQLIANHCPGTDKDRKNVCANGRKEEKVQIYCPELEDTTDLSLYCGWHLSPEQLIGNRCSMEYTIVSERLCYYQGLKHLQVNRCDCGIGGVTLVNNGEPTHGTGCAEGLSGQNCEHRMGDITRTQTVIGPVKSGRRG